MFTTAQIVGLAVCVLVVLTIAILLMRVDNAIVSSLTPEEDAETTADTPLMAAVPGSAATTAAGHRPKTPAGGKNLSRSQRKRHKR